MVDLKSFTSADLVGFNQQISIDGMDCYATESVDISISGKALKIKTKHNNIIADHYEHSQIILTTRLFIQSDSDEFKNIKELYALKKPVRVVTSTGAFKDMVITAFNPEINTSQGLITAAITFTQLVFKKSKRSPSEFPEPPGTFGNGKIDVKSTPSGATVALNSKDTGKTTPCVLDPVETGNPTIELKKEKYVTYSTTVPVVNKKTATVDAKLEELPPPKPSSITITATPAASQCNINSGKITGTTPITDRNYYTKSGDKIDYIMTGDELKINLTADGYTPVDSSKTVEKEKEVYTFTLVKDSNVSTFPDFSQSELMSFAYEAVNQTEFPDSKGRKYTFESFVFNRQTGEIGFVGKVPQAANATGYTDFKCYIKLPAHYKCKGKTEQVSSVSSRADSTLFAPPALSILYETFIPNPVTATSSGKCSYLDDARNTTATTYKSLTFEEMKSAITTKTSSLTFFALTNSSGNTSVAESDIYYDRENGVITFFGVTEKQVKDTDVVEVIGREAMGSLLGLDNYGSVFLFSHKVNGTWAKYTDPWYTEFKLEPDWVTRITDKLKTQLPSGSIVIRTRGCGEYIRWEEHYAGNVNEYGYHDFIGYGFKYYEINDLTKTYPAPDEHQGLYNPQPQVNSFGGIRIQYIKPGASSYVPRIFRLVLSDPGYKS